MYSFQKEKKEKKRGLMVRESCNGLPAAPVALHCTPSRKEKKGEKAKKEA
jgi:hypothetical protein